MYEVFIEWQNSILNKIINYNAQNGLLNSYISLLSRKEIHILVYYQGKYIFKMLKKMK